MILQLNNSLSIYKKEDNNILKLEKVFFNYPLANLDSK